MATELKLTAGDAAEFGKSVVLSGDHAIVGARKPSMSFISPGWAYIFVKSGTSWIQQTKLSAGLKEESSDYFGAAAAIDGDYAVVGAPHVGAEEGQAHVFHRNGSNWTQESVLVPGDPIAFGHFGRSVGLSADWAIVGSNQAAYFVSAHGIDLDRTSQVYGRWWGFRAGCCSEWKLRGRRSLQFYGGICLSAHRDNLAAASRSRCKRRDCEQQFWLVCLCQRGLHHRRCFRRDCQ